MRIILVLIALLVGVATMPKLQYVGDPLAIRAASVCLLNTGRADIPASVAEESGMRGQYYFQNPRNGRYYSKYGAMNTVGYLPVLAIERSITGTLPLYSDAPTRTVLLNLQNVLIAALLALVLLETARLYTDRPWLGSVWVLASMYASFGWNYLRAQTAEISQWLWASVFIYALLRCCRGGSDSVSPSPIEQRKGESASDAYLILGQIALVVLFLLKGVYVLLAAVWFLLVVTLVRTGRIPETGAQRWRWWLKALLPLGLGMAIMLALNYFKFGDALASGYTQWERERHFFSGNVWDGLWGFLSSPSKSIFIYQPLLLVALWGWKEFWQRWRLEAAVILGSFALLWVMNSCTINWGGHWSYGPRYLLAVLSPLSLPALLVGERLWQARSRVMAKIGAFAVAVLLLFSCLLQTQVNALEYFTYYRVEAVLEAYHAQRALVVLHRLPFGVVNYQLRRFAAEDKLPGFVQVASQEVDADLVAPMQGKLLNLVQINYFW